MFILRFLKKNYQLIEIIIVLSIIQIIDHQRPQQLQVLISYIQGLFTPIFPNYNGAFGYKIINIIMGMIVLFAFRKMFIFRAFFPQHFLKEISLSICIGIIMLSPVILGLTIGILKGKNISLNIIAAVLTFSVINSFAEEIINRVYPLVKSSLNSPTISFKQIITNKYLWVSSLFFGLGHMFSFGLWGLTAILSGFAFGLLFQWRGNIWPSFFAHTGMQLILLLVNSMSFSLHFLVMGIALPCSCFFTWWVTFGNSKIGLITCNKTTDKLNLNSKDKVKIIK